MEVVLHQYDLSQGMARQMSQQLLGIHVDGIWHTGIVVDSKEWFFGGGIFFDRPGLTPYGRPERRLVLGTSTKTPAQFEAFVDSIRPRFRMQDYDLLTHNCNNFTNECAIFLLGKGIPQDIIDLPNRALSTPMGAMIRPAIEQYQQSMVTQYANIDQSITAAATSGNPHAHLNVRLLTTGTPIAYNQGTLQAAVERLRELMGATPLPLTVSGMSALPNAAAIVHLDAAVLATLVSDLWALVAVLPEPHRYPVFDLLRVACLHPQCDLTSARERLGALLEATSKPTLIAALRVVQNALLRPLSPVVAVPTDVATGRMVARGLGSPEAAVRKAAATCAYNFALARSSSEALIIVASAAALAVKSGRDAVDSIETLGYVLCMGVACYGNVSTCAALRVHAVPLAPLLASPNAQVALAAQQLAAVLNA